MIKKIRQAVVSQAPNLVSFAGVFPVFLLLDPSNHKYFGLIAAFALLADDLDGMLARYLKVKSDTGKYVDLICDAISHSFLIIYIGLHFGFMPTIVSLVVVSLLVLRLAKMCSREAQDTQGATTNEHVTTICLIMSATSLLGNYTATVLILSSLLPIMTWHTAGRVKTIRRMLNNKCLILFDLLIFVTLHVPILAIVLLTIHLVIFTAGTIRTHVGGKHALRESD